MSSMRSFWTGVVSFSAQVLLALATLPLLPERVATRFGTNGEPVGWMAREAHVGFLLLLAALLNGVFFGFSCATHREDAFSWINIPWKKFWSETAERQREALRRTRLMLYVVGLGANAVIAFAQLLILKQNATALPLPLSMNAYVIAVMTVGALTIVWTWLLFRPYRG